MKRLFNKMFCGKGVCSFLPMVMLIVCSILGTTDAWGSNTYYSALKVTGGTKGIGLVYADKANDSTPMYDVEVTTESTSSSTSQQEDTYHAWAHPCRGSEFINWSGSGTSSISGSANPYTIKVKESKSNNQTNTGVATANWKTYKPCTVHLHASADGAYRLDYTYTDWNGADFEQYNRPEILSTGGDDQDVQLYYTDQVSLSVTSGTFHGWYEDAEFTQPLTEATGSGPYTLAIPNSTTSETEMHIYPKFQTQPKLFGRVNLDFAYGNATDCGYIGITEVVDAEVNYSGTPIGCTHISLVADASTPTSQTYYLHAKPVNVEQNAFVGWFSSQIPSQSSLLSTELDYAYTFDASSTESSTPTTQNVYALFTRISTHYFELTSEPGEAGLGMVYASQTNVANPDYTYFSNYTQVLAEEIYLAGKDANTNFYLYAKPKYGYQFEGWYSDADCTVKVSGNNPYTYAASISSTDPNNPDKAHFYAKFVPATPISVTFEYPTTEGSYNVKAIDIVVSNDGEYEWGETAVLYNSAEETANKTIQIYPTNNLNFTAIPNAGNAVKSWKIAGANVTSGSNNYTAAATSGKAYGVTFGASSPFMVGSQTYSTLDAAISNLGTNKTIIVVENATVAAGHYTIPSGVTLLIPFDDANTITTNHNSMVLENVTKAYNAARTCYRMLTLDPGVIIDVQGSINVGANIASASGGALGCGSINTAYGRIDMKSGSQINLKNGSNLYCWGIISGTEGLVTAESGSTVHEMLQHQSNPGGSKAMGWDNKAFFMNQYYFQNIETPLRINYGATEKVYAELYIQGFQNANASLIGSDGLFRVNDASSYIVKSYDPSTDRTIYDMYGNASMVSLSMSVYVTIDTKKYPMPINNNMTIRCHSNGNASTVTLTYDIDLYPSAKVIIDEGVTLLVKGKLNVYDRDEWVGQSFAHRDLKDIARASFSPTRTHNRTVAELEDAAIEVNGMMRVSEGLYTSTGKANIYSSGSGKILLEKSPSPTNAVYQYKNNTYTGILVPFTAAYLKNGNGSFVSTADASANTTYTYFLGEWKANLTIDGCFAVDNAGHKYIAIDGGYKDVKESTIYSNAWVSRDAESMLFVHTADNCDWLKVFAVEGTTTYLKDAEGNYYEYNSTNGYWVPATQYTATFKNFNGKVLYTTKVFPNGTPVYKGATPIRPTDDEGTYSFNGWDHAIGAINANTEYTAQYSQTPHIAAVKSLGVTSYHTTWASALSAANANTEATLKLLADVTDIATSQTISTSMTLDLNGHELSGTVTKLININGSGKTVTITDNSDEQTGLIATQVDANARCYCVYLTVGTLNIEGGTIRATNEAEYVKSTTEKTQATAVYVTAKYTCNVRGGRVEAFSTYAPYGLQVAGSTTASSRAKAYVTGGEIYAEATQVTEAAGIYDLGIVEMSGGTVTAKTKTTTARGVYVAASTSKYAGTFTMTGGTVNSFTTTTTAHGVSVAVATASGKSYAGQAYIQGGEITATAGTKIAYGIYVGFVGNGGVANTTADPKYYYYPSIGYAKATISGGTITAKTASVEGSTPATDCYGVYSLGETEITGGTITARPTTTTAYGVYSGDGTIHISGNPTILAEATTKAYGAYAGHYYPSTFKLGYMGLGNLIIDGGDITARTTSTTTAYGLYVSAVSKAITSTSSGYYPNPTPYVGYGSATVNGGTITAIAKTTTSVAIYTAAPVTGIVAAKNTAEAISESETVEPVVNINGGKFKAFTNLTTAATCLTVTGTNNSVSLSGGYYGLNTNLSKYVVAPNRVLDCQDAELMDTYPYEVGEGYKVTFKNGSTVLQEGYVKVGATPKYTGADPTKAEDASYTYEFTGWSPEIKAVTDEETYTAQFEAHEKSSDVGAYLDIVDWTESTLTINTNALAASGWPYTINAVQYQKDDRNDDRTLTIPYTGSADGALDITVNNKNSETVSKHSYTIPHIYDAVADLSGVNENSIVYVHSGATVTVKANTSVKAIYVAPDADLVVNNGVILTLADKLVLRTTPWAAAALDNRGTISGGQVYYSYIIANKDQQYYQFAMPLPSNTDNVKTSDEVANNRATEHPYNTAWLMKDYSESSRAKNGATGNNWVALAPGDIRGTVGYELFSMSKYYREYYFPVTLPNTPATTVTVQYTNGSNAADNGWNAVCSPLTKAFRQVFANPARALKVSELMEDGSYWQHIQETIRPATPFYYQASQGQTQLVFGSEMTASAPYRAIDNEEVATEWLQVNYSDAQGHSDETNIFLHPTDFVLDYENGLDVAKLSTTGARPFLYISLACGDLAFVALPDEAAQRIPLTVYSPAEGEYTFSLTDNDYMGRMAAVYLVDEQMGTYTDLLSGDTYSVSVEQGTTAGRFYLMAEFAPAPGVTTGMDEAEGAESMTVEKVFIDGLLYIRRGGDLYDWNGRQVK